MRAYLHFFINQSFSIIEKNLSNIIINIIYLYCTK